MKQRRFIELLWVTGTLLGIAIVAAFFSTIEFYSRALVLKYEESMLWDEVLLYQFTYSVIWAMFAPIVIAVAERFPLRNARNVLIIVAAVPIISFVRTVVGSALLKLFEGQQPTWPFAVLSLHIRFHRNMFYAAVIIGLTNLLLVYREETERERRSLELEARLAKEEVEQLRMKLQPQFLFATLRAIAGLVRTDPAAADRMLVGLSGLLRRNLDFRERSSVTLAEELEFVDRYLGLQGVPLRVELDDELLGVAVPPMFLQPLVDDAVARGGPIEIAGRVTGEELTLEVRADGRRVAETAIASVS
ncbi:MAG TPA: histidine kinase [Thermoanaerobaculia bacterium]|nr:histidine kinase [Thermoanaerobaculia bacterium]